MAGFFLGLALIFPGWCLLFTSGSEVHFIGPGSITPLLTSNITLKCEINETTPPTSSGALVGRRRRDVDHTSDTVHPVAIVIARGHQEIASLSQFSAAQALVSDSNIYVTGSFDGSPRTHGYLSVRYEYPTKDQAGEYRCEVSSVTDKGRGIKLSKNVSIDVSSPTIDDLVDHIHSISIDVRQQQVVIKNQETKIQSLLMENADQKSQLQILQTEDAKLQGEVDSVKHIETGFIDCGDSRDSYWSMGYAVADADDGRVINKTQTFQSPYSKPPIVSISIMEPFYLSKSASTTYFHYGVSVKSVDRNKFVVQCYADDDYGSIFQLRAGWISFPDH